MAYFTKQEARNYAKSVTASFESYSSKLESIVESFSIAFYQGCGACPRGGKYLRKNGAKSLHRLGS